MAEVVGAFAVSHIMFNSFRAEEPELVYESYSEVGSRVQAASPDVVLMISGDHLLNLGGGIHIPFAVGVSDSPGSHSETWGCRCESGRGIGILLRA